VPLEAQLLLLLKRTHRHEFAKVVMQRGRTHTGDFRHSSHAPRTAGRSCSVEWVGEDAMQYGDLVKRYSKET
jgi:hypothetical protein